MLRLPFITSMICLGQGSIPCMDAFLSITGPNPIFSSLIIIGTNIEGLSMVSNNFSSSPQFSFNLACSRIFFKSQCSRKWCLIDEYLMNLEWQNLFMNFNVESFIVESVPHQKVDIVQIV